MLGLRGLKQLCVDAILKLRMEVWAGDTHSAGLFVKVVFKTMELMTSPRIVIQKRRGPGAMLEASQHLNMRTQG